MLPLTDEQAAIERAKARRAAHLLHRRVAAIPEDRRALLAARLRRRGVNVTDASLLREWRWWQQMTTDRDTDQWKEFHQ